MRYLLLFVCLTCWTCLGQMPMDGTYNLSPQTASSAPAAGYYALWQADSLSGSDGDNKTSWTDQSSQAITAVGQGLLTNNLVNGHNSIWVGGAYHGYAAVEPVSISQPFVRFIATKLDTAALGSTVYTAGSTNTSPEVTMFIDSGPTYCIYAGALLYAATGAAYPITNWTVLTFVYNGASSALYTNGSLAVTGNAGTGAQQGIDIGGVGGTSSGYNWAGQIAEDIFYTNSLATGDRQQTETYLGSKYGITIYH